MCTIAKELFRFELCRKVLYHQNIASLSEIRKLSDNWADGDTYSLNIHSLVSSYVKTRLEYREQEEQICDIPLAAMPAIYLLENSNENHCWNSLPPYYSFSAYQYYKLNHTTASGNTNIFLLIPLTEPERKKAIGRIIATNEEELVEQNRNHLFDSMDLTLSVDKVLNLHRVAHYDALYDVHRDLALHLLMYPEGFPLEIKNFYGNFLASDSDWEQYITLLLDTIESIIFGRGVTEEEFLYACPELIPLLEMFYNSNRGK